LHRVSPLRHVLDFFTLVNLMNQFRPEGMNIDVFLSLLPIVDSEKGSS
jgi:hypothetical protein